MSISPQLLFFIKILLLFGMVYSIIKNLKYILAILALIFLILMAQSYFDMNLIDVLRNLINSYFYWSNVLLKNKKVIKILLIK